MLRSCAEKVAKVDGATLVMANWFYLSSVKDSILNKPEIPRKQFPCSILIASSLTCHEEIGRAYVRRFGQGCNEDATRKLLPWNISYYTARTCRRHQQCTSHLLTYLLTYDTPRLFMGFML